MYATNLEVHDLKLIHDLRLSFKRPDGSIRKWTVLVGENGLCKTTLLRALAVAAVGAETANQLADVTSFPDRRSLEPKAVRIDAEFTFGPNGHKLATYPSLSAKPLAPPSVESTVSLEPGLRVLRGSSHYTEQAFWGSDPLTEALARGDRGWFVAGYGVQRDLPVPYTATAPDDRIVGRLAPLFAKGGIIGTGFVDLFEPELARQYAAVLKQALVDNKLLPLVTDVELRGRGGVRASKDLLEASRFEMQTGASTFRVPAVWLSQGYQAMIAWVADLIGHAMLEAEGPIELHELEALVLIDELDLFLHPAWQVRLVSNLKTIFPNVQFVATTHSPMVLPGLEKDEIYMLEADEEGNVVVEAAPASPKLLTGSEIYSLFFELDRLYPEELAALLQDYGFLALNPQRTPLEDAKLTAIRNELARQGVPPQFDPVPMERDDAPA